MQAKNRMVASAPLLPERLPLGSGGSAPETPKLSSNKIPMLLTDDLKNLRGLIKQDVREVLQVELKRLKASFQRHEHFSALEQVCEPPFEDMHLLSGNSNGDVASREIRRGRSNLDPLEEMRTTSGLDMQKIRKIWRVENTSLRAVQNVRDIAPSLAPKYAWDMIERCAKIREPPREGCLAGVVHSRAFEGIYTVVILLNVLFMVFQVNYGVRHPTNDATPLMAAIDIAFLVAYTAELAMKLLVHRLFLFWNADMAWNLLDFLLVGYSFCEQLLERQVSGHDAKWVRMLRMLRVAKVLRVFRVVKSFSELQLILNCILGSFMSMVWSVVMIALAFYMFSLVLVQQTSTYLAEIESDVDTSAILEYFGSVESAMWTLFKATFGGDDWSVYYAEVAKLGLLADGIWFLFVVFTQIALLNILTGIFVESALQLAEGDPQLQALKHEEMTLESAQELKKMCEEYDNDSSGSLTREEFRELAEGEEFSRYLRFIGLDLRNVEVFFSIISHDVNQAVSIDDFVAGCMALRGSAKSSDLMALLLEVKKVNHASTEAREDISECLREIKNNLGRSQLKGGAATNDLPIFGTR